MSLCRHLLLRGNVPKRIPTSIFCGGVFFNKYSLSSVAKHDGNVRVSVKSTPPFTKVSDEAKSDALHKETTSSDELLSLRELLPKPAPSKRPSSLDVPPSAEESGATEVPESSMDGSHKGIAAYESLRSRDVAVANGLSVDGFIRLAQDASRAGLPDVMDHLATDLVENYQCSDADRLQIASFIATLTAERPLLSYAQLQPILHIIKSYGSLASLSDRTVIRLTKIILSHLSHDPSSDSSVSLLLALLDKCLWLSAPKFWGASAITYQPLGLVQLSYHLVQKLLHVNRHQQALEVFQVLVDRDHIPPEAIHETDKTSTDSSFIILSTLVRSCLHWGWRRSAVELCKVLLRAEASPSALVIDLTLDVLYTLLETPTHADLGQFSYVIRELDRRAVNHLLPHGLIRLFYECAHKLDATRPAEVLYDHTQAFDVVHKQYPSPQGPALTWLLSHLALTRRNIYLSRQLTNHVVDSNEPIPPQDRARFISIVASSGFGLPARTLWERYTVGRDRNAILGSATAMLRVVSLFAYTIRKTLSQIEEEVQKENTITTKSERALYEDRLKDITEFVHFVVAEFRRVKEPLAAANHFHLTSLARAYFILGDITAGFGAFKALLDRKEIPDLYDVNVALSAMAEYSPHDAARMIDRMIDKGVNPDPVTFGTVIHFAMVYRDAELVSKLINKARLVDNAQLTLKSVEALIKSSTEMEGSSVGINLGRALDIIKSLTMANIMCSPRTGKYCVAASLSVQRPVLAFKFWKLLVQNKVEWDDSEHIHLRRRMGRQIRIYGQAGQISEDLQKVMLHLLAEDLRIG